MSGDSGVDALDAGPPSDGSLLPDGSPPRDGSAVDGQAGDATTAPPPDGAGPLPDSSVPQGSAEPVEVGPCVSAATAAPSYNLCVWTSEQDLARIHADPMARIEIPAAVSLNGRRYEGVEFEIHGGASRNWAKKSYRVRFVPKPRPVHDFFGTGLVRAERLVLQAAWIDPSFMRNKVIFDTLNEVGAMAPRLGFARLYINGRLNGLYQVIERVDEHFLDRQGFARSGNLYKAESEAADFRFGGDTLGGFQENTNEDGVAEDLEDLFRTIFETERTYEAYQREVATRIDLDDFHLWNIVMSHMLNVDTFIKNYYLYHDAAATEPARGSVFRIIHWDADSTLGMGWNTVRVANPEYAALWSQIDEDGRPDNELSQRLYAIPEYRAAYLARFDELLRGPLSAAALWAKAEPLLTALEADIRADYAQWGREWVFEEERDFLKQMMETRARVMAAAVAEARAMAP